jgi:CheY-like chemotaxis protein
MGRAELLRVLPNPRILVADDDLALLEAVALALEHLGADVVAARSGAELVDAIAEAGPFALVVTDVAMPWMTGLQALHSARTAGLDTPVIVITALRSERVDEQVSTLGANVALLRKPFAISDLEHHVAAMLARTPGASQDPTPP